MTPQEKQQEQRTILEQQHKEWSHHPITALFIKVLDSHLNDYLIGKIANNLNDQEIRFLAAQIKQTKTLKDFVTNTEAFVNNQLNKQQ